MLDWILQLLSFPSGVNYSPAVIAQGAVQGMLLFTETTADASEPAQAGPTCHRDKDAGSYVGCVVFSSLYGVVTSLVGLTASAAFGAIWGTGQTAAGYGPQPLEIIIPQDAVQQIIERPEVQMGIPDQLKEQFVSARNVRPHIFQDSRYE